MVPLSYFCNLTCRSNLKWWGKRLRMQPIYLEMKQGRSQKKFRKWRSEGLLKALFVMTGVLEVTAWYSCFCGRWFWSNLSLVGNWRLFYSDQVILDVPTVGGRLMLVDMAGSENIEQAGQTGFEAKMQVIIFLPCRFSFFNLVGSLLIV